MTENRDASDYALEYVRRGWNPVPVLFKGKKPIGEGWPTRIIREADVRKHFNGAPLNVGVQEGVSSNGLTDVDLDCPESVVIAPFVLPKTEAVFGRASNRDSHRLYITNLHEGTYGAAIQFKDPMPKGNDTMLFEIRIGGKNEAGEVKGAQTVFPGSVHESGEDIFWEETGEPAIVDGDELLRLARRLGACCLLARHWSGKGGRHDAALAVGGFLARTGLKPPEVKCLVEAIARAAGDDEWRDRVKAAEDTAKAYSKDKPTCGFPKLKEIFGEVIAKQVAEWLDYQSNNDDIGNDDISRDQSAKEESAEKLKATPYTWTEPEKVPPRKFLYGHRLARKYVTATVASGGVGKTSLEIVEVLSMVSGRALLGVQTPQLQVWLWTLEDPIGEMKRRIQAAARRYNLTAQDIGDRLFVDSGREQPLVIAEQSRKGLVIRRPLADEIIAEIKERKIDVLIIDPFVSCHRVTENDNNAIDAVTKEWARVADKADCAVELAHHVRKGEQEITVESARGGGAFGDACRMVRVINRMTEQQAKETGINNRRLYFRTYIDKDNLAPPADKCDWFKLESIDLGNGVFGSGGDSIGVVTKWKWPDATETLTGHDFERAAIAIRGGTWRADPQAKQWVGRAIAKALGRDLDNPAGKAAVKQLVRYWIGTGALVVVERLTEKRELKEFVELAEGVE